MEWILIQQKFFVDKLNIISDHNSFIVYWMFLFFSLENRLSPVASDIKLETESDLGSDEDIPIRFDSRYQPRVALKCAISEWFMEFSEGRQPQLVYPALVQPPSMPLDISPILNMGNISPETYHLKDLPVCVDPSFLQPSMKQIPLNSLAPCPSVSDKIESTEDLEPMDFVPSSVLEENLHKDSSMENLMQVEMCSDCNQNSDVCERCMSHEDVSLLVDLFYLPFDHGTRGVKLLQELYWLKMNAHIVIGTTRSQSNQVS